MLENNMLKIKGFDCCIVGVLEMYGNESTLCYSIAMMQNKILSADPKITYEEADSYIRSLVESPPAMEDMPPVAFISSDWEIETIS